MMAVELKCELHEEQIDELHLADMSPKDRQGAATLSAELEKLRNDLSNDLKKTEEEVESNGTCIDQIQEVLDGIRQEAEVRWL